MKRWLLFFSVLTFFSLTACVQNRTCVCSDKNEYLVKAKKSDASKMCKTFETDSITCEVK